jgi:hypothetical protein
MGTIKASPVKDITNPLVLAARYIITNASDETKSYWASEARKKKYSLEQMIVIYLLKDFGILTPTDLSTYLIKKSDLITA